MATYCSQKEIYINYPFAIKEGDGLFFGAYVNTLVAPLVINSEKDFFSLIKDLEQHIAELKSEEGLRHSYLPTSI